MANPPGCGSAVWCIPPETVFHRSAVVAQEIAAVDHGNERL
jgi:hypothetical protein